MQAKIEKLKVAVVNDLVHYQWLTKDGIIDLNAAIGKNIKVTFNNEIRCSSCDAKTKKSFQGFCFKCFSSSPDNSECIIRPELCRGHLGEGRDAEWEQKNHNQPHIVYLAATSGVKVGVTRGSNALTRWIDQGANQTIILAEVPYRYLAGRIEVELKSFISDKTNWQKMLKGEDDQTIDLLNFKNDLARELAPDLQDFISVNDTVTQLNYPIQNYPSKVKSINLDKDLEFNEKLIGIRGQYLIFESEKVINIRKYSGYIVDIEII